jgi:HK97 family phage prohead protease
MNEIVRPRRPLVPSDMIVDHPDAVITVRKARASADTAGSPDFVLSDETPDRMGDVIRADGWQLDNFRKNPIALFGHRADFPIGIWSRLRVEDGALRGLLTLAPQGTSSRLDEIRRLVKVHILPAVSVGFSPIESRPRGAGAPGGILFEKQELVEASLVAIPANPNALIAAKSLGISEETRKVVFAERGVRREKSSPITKEVNVITNLDARITRLQRKAQDVRAELEQLISRQQDCSAAAREAVDSVQFYGSPEILALRDESLSHECMRGVADFTMLKSPAKHSTRQLRGPLMNSAP